MSPDLESLLEGSGWVDRLARSLVADPHAADDLVQEAWVVALERGPKGVDGIGRRRWLSAVLRNLARDRRRGERRRSDREADVASGAETEQEDDAAAMLQQLDAHRRVVDAVRALDEPYRSAVLMRYFDGKSPAEIARRLDVPVKTVQSRLHRALAKLRASLRRDFGGGAGTWLLALVPLSERSGWTGGALAGGALSGALIMDAKLKITLAAVAVAGVTALATFSGGARVVPSASEPMAVDRGDVELAAPTLEQPPVPVVASGRAREEVDVAPVAAPEVVAEAAPFLNGRVLLADGSPLAGVRVAMEGEGDSVDSTTSGTDGGFRFDGVDRPTGEIYVADDRYTPVLTPSPRAPWNENSEAFLVVAPRRPLGGIVVDAEGRRLPDATLMVDIPSDFHARFESGLETSRVVRWSATTDAEGRFDLPDAPGLERGFLVTVCPGFARDIRDVPPAPDDSLEIVLGAQREESRLLEGRVVDLDGLPVEGANVAIEFSNGTTDADGRFALALNGPGERGVLMALKKGSLPARLERRTASDLDPDAWPDPLVLVLGGEPLSIRGRVVDADGEPVEGARVWTPDLTHFGAVEAPEFGPRTTVAADVETLLRSRERGDDVRTDEDGAFVLDGLIEREYRVSVHDRKTYGFLRTEPVSAGATGLTITLPREDRILRVAGRVVGTDGEPVPGARVSLRRMVGVRNGFPDDISIPNVKCDDRGLFEFDDVPASFDHVLVGGPGLDFDQNRTRIPDGADLESLELVVMRRCQLRIELSDPAEADGFHLLDPNGERKMLMVARGNVAWTTERGSIMGGRSESIQVSENVSTLVLLKGSDEVRRVPLRLRFDELNVIAQ
ncbi:MAG: sigma-70 family RNA polymerase sigma factor [Planctomycetota bacterium]